MNVLFMLVWHARLIQPHKFKAAPKKIKKLTDTHSCADYQLKAPWTGHKSLHTSLTHQSIKLAVHSKHVCFHPLSIYFVLVYYEIMKVNQNCHLTPLQSKFKMSYNRQHSKAQGKACKCWTMFSSHWRQTVSSLHMLAVGHKHRSTYL